MSESDHLSNFIQEVCAAAHKAIGTRDVGRTDVRVVLLTLGTAEGDRSIPYEDWKEKLRLTAQGESDTPEA